MANGKNNSLLEAQKIALELSEENKGAEGKSSTKQNQSGSSSAENTSTTVVKETTRIISGPAELPAPKKKKSSSKQKKVFAKKIKKTNKSKSVSEEKFVQKKTLVDVAKENPSVVTQTVKEDTYSMSSNFDKTDSRSFEESVPKSSVEYIEMIGGLAMVLISLEIIAIIVLVIFLLFFK